jgi:hypothetical protein
MSQETIAMTKELFEEREKLSGAAYEILHAKDTEEILPVFRIHVYSIYVLPATYVVYQHYHQHNTYFAIIKRWRQDLDLNKLKNPTERLKHPNHLAPTIEKFSFKLRTEFIQNVWMS